MDGRVVEASNGIVTGHRPLFRLAAAVALPPVQVAARAPEWLKSWPYNRTMRSSLV
jgi:hypothetical protein